MGFKPPHWPVECFLAFSDAKLIFSLINETVLFCVFVSKTDHCLLNFDRSTVKHALQNTQNDCHQWLSDSSRVHRIRFWPGLCPDPAGGAYNAPSGPLAGLTWVGWKGEGEEEEAEVGRNCVNPPFLFSVYATGLDLPSLTMR